MEEEEEENDGNDDETVVNNTRVFFSNANDVWINYIVYIY
jgi:hypothetical protein